MSEHVVPVKVYWSIFAALLVLTVVTIWVAFVDLGSFNVLVALTIAVLKASLVVLYFMHVRYSSHLTWLFAGAGFFWLLLLLLFTLGDILSRSWIAGPTGWM